MQNGGTISKWGNSLAVRIPQSIAKQARLKEGDSIALELNISGDILLKPTKRRYDLAELVEGITPLNRHSETDWGSAQGEESW